MIIRISFCFLLLVFSLSTYSQDNKQKARSGIIKHTIGVNIPAAISEFSKTHTIGAGIDYAFEINTEKNVFHLAFNAGVTHYLGKNIKNIDYSYKYPGFTFIHAMGGTHCRLKDLDLRLLAGPAIGIYDGISSFNIGSRFEANYFIGPGISIGPLVNMMWEPGTRALWSAGIKAAIDL